MNSSFTATFQATGPGIFRRQILIDSATTNPALIPRGVFRIRPVLTGSTRLVCSGVTGLPVVSTADDALGFQYFFQIVEDCINLTADFNGDGIVDPDDLADYIGCYFSIPPCAGADFNADTIVDPDDLADFITVFFMNPCG